MKPYLLPALSILLFACSTNPRNPQSTQDNTVEAISSIEGDWNGDGVRDAAMIYPPSAKHGPDYILKVYSHTKSGSMVVSYVYKFPMHVDSVAPYLRLLDKKGERDSFVLVQQRSPDGVNLEFVERVISQKKSGQFTNRLNRP